MGKARKWIVSTDVIILVMHSTWELDDIQSLFSDYNRRYDGPILVVDEQLLPNLLVKLNIYESTSKARQAGREGKIPTGYKEIKVSKFHTLYIWNPTTSSKDFEDEAKKADEDHEEFLTLYNLETCVIEEKS